MLNIVYPYIPSTWGEELKYSLRSLDKNLKADFRVIIYGSEKPEWLNIDTVEFIHNDCFIQPPGSVRAQFNQGLIYQRIINRGDIDNFIYFNDDIYLLQPVNSLNAVYMLEKNEFEHKLLTTRWRHLLNDTLLFLKGTNNTYFNYETHIPYPLNTKRLSKYRKVLGGVHLLATTYYNREKFGPVEFSSTVKITCFQEENINKYIPKFDSKKYIWFNHNDRGLHVAKHMLPKLFPHKSKFEC